MFDGVLHCLCFVFTVLFLPFCLVSLRGGVQYNGGLLPDIILLTPCYFHRGTRFNAIRGFVFTAFDPT